MLLAADHSCRKVISYDLVTFEENFKHAVSSHPLRVRKLNSDEFVVSPYRTSDPCALTVHDKKSGRELRRRVGCKVVYALETALPPPGETAGRFMTGEENEVCVFNSETCSLVTELHDPPRDPQSMRYVPEWDHELHVVGDNSLRLYDLTRAKLLGKLTWTGYQYGSDCGVAESTVVAVGSDGTMKIWARRSLLCVSTLQLGVGGEAHSCLVAEDLCRIFAGRSSGKVGVWDTRMTSKKITTLHPCTGLVYEMVRVNTDEFVAVGGTKVTRFDKNGLITKEILSKQALFFGVCTMDAPFDRLLKSLEEVAIEDFEERCLLILESVSEGAGAGSGFLQASAGSVVVAGSRAFFLL